VATISSRKISEIFAKKKKVFEDGSGIEKCLVVTTDLLLMNLKM
jgi:hypothetical protein